MFDTTDLTPITLGNRDGFLVPVTDAAASLLVKGNRLVTLAKLTTGGYTKFVSMSGLTPVASLGPAIAFKLPAHSRTIYYGSQAHTVPVPNLIFIWNSLRNPADTRVLVHSDADVQYEKLTAFQVGNVWSGGDICFGGFVAGTSPGEIISTFLDSPFNSDLEITPVFINEQGWDKLDRSPQTQWDENHAQFFRLWQQLELTHVQSFTPATGGKSLVYWLMRSLGTSLETDDVQCFLELEGQTYLAIDKSFQSQLNAFHQFNSDRMLFIGRGDRHLGLGFNHRHDGVFVADHDETLTLCNHPDLRAVEMAKALYLTGIESDRSAVLRGFEAVQANLLGGRQAITYLGEAAAPGLWELCYGLWEDQAATVWRPFVEDLFDTPVRLIPGGIGYARQLDVTGEGLDLVVREALGVLDLYRVELQGFAEPQEALVDLYTLYTLLSNPHDAYGMYWSYKYRQTDPGTMSVATEAGLTFFEVTRHEQSMTLSGGGLTVELPSLPLLTPREANQPFNLFNLQPVTMNGRQQVFGRLSAGDFVLVDVVTPFKFRSLTLPAGTQLRIEIESARFSSRGMTFRVVSLPDDLSELSAQDERRLRTACRSGKSYKFTNLATSPLICNTRLASGLGRYSDAVRYKLFGTQTQCRRDSLIQGVSYLFGSAGVAKIRELLADNNPLLTYCQQQIELIKAHGNEAVAEQPEYTWSAVA